MNLECVTIEKPESVNFILGQSHFIKTVEDVHETLVQAVPGIQFGLAFCEASGPRLLRLSGTSPDVVDDPRQSAPPSPTRVPALRRSRQSCIAVVIDFT